jgi:Ran-binding protein 3
LHHARVHIQIKRKEMMRQPEKSDPPPPDESKHTVPKNIPDETAKEDPSTASDSGPASSPQSRDSGADDHYGGAEGPVREKLKKASITALDGKREMDGEEVKEESTVTDATAPARGRPVRKRSYDDLQKESVSGFNESSPEESKKAAGSHHKRMRSRDVVPSSKETTANVKVEQEHVGALAEEEDDVDARRTPGGAGVMVQAPLTDDDMSKSGLRSPKKKRSRDQFDKDHTTEVEPRENDGDGGTLPESRELNKPDQAAPTISTSNKGEPEKKRHRDVSNDGREVTEVEAAPTAVWMPSDLGFITADLL